MKFNRIQTAFLLNQAEMFLHGTWFQILVFTGSKDISMLVRIVFLYIIDQCIRKRDLSEGAFAFWSGYLDVGSWTIRSIVAQPLHGFVDIYVLFLQ